MYYQYTIVLLQNFRIRGNTVTWPGKRLQQHGLVLKDNGGDPSFLMFRDILGKTIFCNYLFLSEQAEVEWIRVKHYTFTHLPPWIWSYSNVIDCAFSCKLCYWKSFVEKGLSISVNDCRFVITNFISTKMKMHLKSMNVKGWYCLSFDYFEC